MNQNTTDVPRSPRPRAQKSERAQQTIRIMIVIIRIIRIMIVIIRIMIVIIRIIVLMIVIICAFQSGCNMQAQIQVNYGCDTFRGFTPRISPLLDSTASQDG